MKVLAFGEILWDKIAGNHYLGGAPLNFAAHFVKCGGTSSILSSVGEDLLGKDAIEQIKQLHVDSSFISTTPHYSTGTVDVFLSNGQPDYSIEENVAFDYITSPSRDHIVEKEFDIFYFGSLAQRNSVSRASLRYILENVSCKYVFYDINIRKKYYSDSIIRYSLKCCTIFKINDDEVQIVSVLLYKQVLEPREFCIRVTKDFNIELIIVTAGAKGCYLFNDSKMHFIPPVKVVVVDTVGAGDAFSAAFMYHYGKGLPAIQAASLANELGAYVAASKGAIPVYSKEIIKRLSV